eukprot:tig00000317_g24029.t1
MPKRPSNSWHAHSQPLQVPIVTGGLHESVPLDAVASAERICELFSSQTVCGFASPRHLQLVDKDWLTAPASALGGSLGSKLGEKPASKLDLESAASVHGTRLVLQIAHQRFK